VKIKTCRKCGLVKPIDQFSKNSKNKDGWNGSCKECKSNALRNMRERYRASNRNFDYGQERILRCHNCGKLKSSLLFFKYKGSKTGFQTTCKECDNSARRRRKYGIVPEALCALIKQQNSQCAICGTALTKEFHIDHSHVTNAVRGLLCGSCNLGIGIFKDTPAILRSAATYLEQYSKEKTDVA